MFEMLFYQSDDAPARRILDEGQHRGRPEFPQTVDLNCLMLNE
jgi:hypothetical protein